MPERVVVAFKSRRDGGTRPPSSQFAGETRRRRERESDRRGTVASAIPLNDPRLRQRTPGPGRRRSRPPEKSSGTMDSFASDRKLSELGQLDLQDLLDQSDLFDDDQLDTGHRRPQELTSRRRRRHDTADTDCVSHFTRPPRTDIDVRAA